MCKYDSNGDRTRNYLLNISLPSNHCSVKEAEVTPPWWKETLLSARPLLRPYSNSLHFIFSVVSNSTDS